MRSLFTAILFLSAMSLLAQDTGPSRALDYDSKAPLNIQEAGVEHRGRIAIHDISYASPKGGRVPAYLVVPEGKGPFAAVLWGHWYWLNSDFFNRKEFLEEAVVLARVGVISLLPTGVNARPGHVNDPDELSDQQVASWSTKSWTCGAALICSWHGKMSIPNGLPMSATAITPPSALF